MSRPVRVKRVDVACAVTVVVLAFAILAVMPLAARFDETLSADLSDPSQAGWWVVALTVVAQGALLAFATAAPRSVLVGVALIAVVASFAPQQGLDNVTLIAVAPAAYFVARRLPLAEVWPTLAAAAALVSGVGFVAARQDPAVPVLFAIGVGIGQAALVVGAPVAIAVAVRARDSLHDAREAEATARLLELEARAEAALAAERTAIARELHDIAAHHLSGIALMSAAISRQIDTDPQAAKVALADVRTQTRTLLDELRGLVALLRHDDGASVAPVQTIAALGTLIPDAAARGLDARLDLPEGETLDTITRGIGPLGQFAAYRTVQEALANVARHAPGVTCVVELRDAGEFLDITVANGPSSAQSPLGVSGGFGLRGMVERASLTRSQLTYGPTEQQGWRVSLRVPREAQ